MYCKPFGERLRLTVFGASHAPAVGMALEGFPAGMTADFDAMEALLRRRAPGSSEWVTARREADRPFFYAGLRQGVTCGETILALIPNRDARSGDYDRLRDVPRPGHADFAARLKYGDAWDGRGGGQFSGRMTVALCVAGAFCLQYLRQRGVSVAAHIAQIGDLKDDAPDFLHPSLPLYPDGAFPTLSAAQGERMRALLAAVRAAGDSVGGAVRCLITGLPGGLGGPLFAGLEGRLAAAMFAIPAVRGVEFGSGFAACATRGHENNDAFGLSGGAPAPLSTRHGGVLGGVSTGCPVVLRVGFKPTPSIALPQRSVNLKTLREETLALSGRHDPCVVVRAVPVVEAVAALALVDLMLEEE